MAYELDIMRRPSIEKPPLEARLYAAAMDISHAQSDDAGVGIVIPTDELGMVGSVKSDEVESLKTGSLVFVTQTKKPGESGDASAAVSTHRAEAAVAVVVFHLKIVGRLRIGKGHYAVGTNAETAMTDVGNPLAVKVGLSGFILTDVDNDKVVACTVEFIKEHYIKDFRIN